MDTADLHLHSLHSDGEWSPTRLVREARSAGVRAVALTDHDTVTGLGEALEAGRAMGVEVLTGVEVSAWRDVDWHVLGYGFEAGDPTLGALFGRAREARLSRAARMVELLAELGRPVSLEAVLREAGAGVVGRPHVARALYKAGQVGSVREAFDLYLGDGKPACVPKLRVSPEEAIELIHRAGGVAVAAHPGCYGGPDALEPLRAAGLDGVEVDHNLHDADMTRRLADYAAQHGLVRTGGSDFHGPRAGIAAVGSVRIPYERVVELRERIAQRRAEAGATGTGWC